jgi:SRSO17 transposase
VSELERKTIEPMVLALLGADRTAVRGLQEFIGHGAWSAAALWARQQALAGEWLGHPQGVLIVDGSGFPKQGLHSVGVARQYCGALVKIANCQEGVFAVYASPAGASLVDARLYLPAEWLDDLHRPYWPTIGSASETTFQTEPAFALEMITQAVQRGQLPFAWVTPDEHFGQNPGFLDEVAALGQVVLR